MKDQTGVRWKFVEPIALPKRYFGRIQVVDIYGNSPQGGSRGVGKTLVGEIGSSQLCAKWAGGNWKWWRPPGLTSNGGVRLRPLLIEATNWRSHSDLLVASPTIVLAITK